MSGVSPDFAVYEAKHAALRLHQAELRQRNETALFDALAAAGIASVLVNFDGSGDQGQIEAVMAFDAENTLVELPMGQIEQRKAAFGTLEVAAVLHSPREVVEAMTYGLLEQLHDGWETGEGAYGEFRFSLEERSVTLECNERHTEATYHQHTF